jgi:transporter family-2 protein
VKGFELTGFLPIATLMLVSGIGIPMMATMNGAIGRQVNSPAAATAILFAMGCAVSLIVLSIVGAPPAAKFAGIPKLYYFGACFMVFYVIAVTYSAPRIGVGNAIFFVLLGQMISMSVIDHYGIWGAIKTEITTRRLIGLAVMTLGIYLARKPS